MPLAALCQRCALCCDGELFDSVPLAPAEVGVLRRLPILAGAATHAPDRGDPPHPAVDDRPRGALPQPCSALRDRRCTIYPDRPDACRRYRCMLAFALDAGEVDLVEAGAVVDEARARLSALAADLPGDGPVLSRARAAARAGHLSSETHARLARAHAFLDRRFRGHTRR